MSSRDDNLTLALSVGFSLAGGYLGGYTGAQLGWFIGSTIGSLLALEDLNETTQGPRVTDFKSFNSKYGIPINQGYGCVRLAGNLVWSSEVTEIGVSETTCEKSDGFFGIGAQTVCQTVVQYFYYQSAAIAFAEGEADVITRLWADGKLVYDITPGGPGIIPIVTIKQDINGNEYEYSVEVPFTFYPGSQTQAIDPVVAAGLADEATAFRNIVYIALDNLELNTFGFRLPVFNAEVCFNSLPPVQNITALPSSIQGGSTVSDYESLGLVAGSSTLQAGVSTDGSGVRVLYDIVSGQIVVDEVGGFDSAADTPDFFTLTPDFLTLRSLTVSGEYYVGPFNYVTGVQVYWVRYTTAGDLAGTGGGIQNVIVNKVTGQLCADFAGGAAGCFPTFAPTINQSTGGLDEVEGFIPVTLGGFTELGLTPVVENSTSQFSTFYTNGGGTSDPARELFIDPQGNLWWLVDGAGGVWVNRTTAVGIQNHWRVRFVDTTNVASVGNWTYSSKDDAFLLYVDTAGSDPTGLYKLGRSAFVLGATTVDLPADVAGSYLLTTVVDSTAFQAGPSSGGLYFSDGTNLLQVNTSSVEVAVDYGPPAVPIGLSTVFSPETQAIRVNSFNVLTITVEGAPVVLNEVVQDLIVRSNGNTRAQLYATDVDITALTDNVRGYPLLQQQTIRNAIVPLQQAYFFDVVETDGRIKFVKRGAGSAFNISENALAAHEYGKTNKTTLVPLEFERQSDVEQPRELAVNYTDIDLDYNQGTQRARIQHTDSDSNIQKTVPIVFNADEAAQIADILLSTAWTERVAPFKFSTGPYFMNVDPTDLVTLTMNDGTIHSLRIVEMNIGANSIIQFVGVNDYASLYTSTAVGVAASNPPQVIPGSGGNVEVFLVDVPTGFTSSISGVSGGVVGGIGSFGPSDSGGGIIATGSGAGTSTSDVVFGSTTSEFGSPSGPLATDQFDYETVITGNLLGGVLPASCTETQALAAGADCLVVVGQEIIAFTTITANAQTTVTGTDISFVNGTSSIDSVSTDFVAAGFTSGMFLRIAGSTLNGVDAIYEIDTVSTNQIVLINAPVTESAGASITVTHAGGDFTLSGGLLRGLYGTELSTYHPDGEQIIFGNNLVFVPTSSGTNVLLGGTGTSASGSTGTATVVYEGQNQRPWSPVDIYGGRGVDGDDTSVNDFVFSWVRRDKTNGAGLVDYGGGTTSSEASIKFEIDILDGTTAGSENSILRTVSVGNVASYSYPEIAQIADFGEIQERPILIDIYQISATVGRGFRARTLVDKDNNYHPIGTNYGTDTLAAAAANTTGRWDGAGTIVAGTEVGDQALEVTTSVDGNWGAVSFDEAGPSHNTEVYTVLELPAGSITELHAGVVLRGQGVTANTQVTGLFIGLGGAANNVFAVRQILGGSTTGSGVYLDSATYAWSTATAYSLRARAYENRIKGKIWVYGEPEPSTWQLDTYDGGLGPFFGFTGVFASASASDPLYHYTSWAHRGLTAA